MTNFVLTGLPNFIVVGTPWQPSLPQQGGEPEHVDDEFEQVLVALGVRRGSQALSDPIAYTEGGTRAMKRVLERFGFERNPDTCAELYGLFDYCDRLTTISGVGMLPARELARWQARSFLLVSRHRLPVLQAVTLYALGDLAALRAWHREADTLGELGRAYTRLP